MKMYQSIFYFLGFISLLIVLSGCASFPPPLSDSDTMLIILKKMEGEGTTGTTAAYRYKMWFKRGGEEKSFSLGTMSDYALIRGLPPGKHTISSISFFQAGERYKVDVPIKLKPKTIHFAPFIVITRMTQSAQYLDIKPALFKDKFELVNNKLRDFDNFSLWDIEYD